MPVEISVAEWIIIGLLVLVVLLLISVRLGVAQLQARLNQALQASERPSLSTQEGSESAFDQFLSEDPERHKLSKTEQFAAYREWRKVNGMNWSS